MTAPASKAERLKAAIAERDMAYRAWVEADRALDEARVEYRRKVRAIEEEP